MTIPIALRLAVRQWLGRPLRPVLCSLAIAAAVALIICVGAAMDSLRYSVSTAIGQMLGVAEVHVRPAQKGTEARVPEAMLKLIRALPEVDFADGRLYGHAAILMPPATGAASQPGGAESHWFDVVGIDPASDEKLRPKIYDERLHAGLSADEMMVDSLVAEQLHLSVGQKVQYSLDGTSSRPMTVTAIVHRPSLEIIAQPTLYVTLESLLREKGMAAEYTVIDIKLKDTAGVSDYDAYAGELEKMLGPSVQVTPGTTSKAKMVTVTRVIDLILLVLSIISALCAALIIGTTLSVGIQERVRQFGQLRCIGASRRQLMQFLGADALLMLALGLALGAGLGMGLSAALVAWFPQLFIAYRISAGSLGVAFLSGGVATLLGAAIPVWQIARVSPMAAVSAVGQRVRVGHVRLAAVLGAACLLAQALLWVLIPGRDAKFYTYIGAGIPLIFAGWSLLAPAILVGAEGAAATVLGRVLGVRPQLLRSAWSRTPWRAGAMIVALMIGVTLFVAVRARAASLEASWVSPAKIPDLILKSFVGLNERRLESLRKEYPQVREFSEFDWFTVTMSSSAFRMGSLLNIPDMTFIAADPETFPKFVELEYVQGDPQTATEQLKKGGYVFISKEYHNVRHVGVGDKVTIMGYDGKPVDFTIAAVVTSTGMELVKNFFDLRAGYADRSMSSVLGSLSDAQRYFKMKDPTLALVNVSPEAEQRAAVAELRAGLAREGMQTVSSVELKTMIHSVLDRIIGSLSIIALGALCVASLGVANMVIAAVQARRFEFGVLRAVGAGRGQLVRLVLAEVTLIGMVAGVLGLAVGLHFTFMEAKLDMLVVGLPTSFLATDYGSAVWLAVRLAGEAVVLTTVLAWLASLMPAIRGATAAQQVLLAAGRA